LVFGIQLKATVEGNLGEMPEYLFGENGIREGHTQSPEVKNVRQVVQDDLQGDDCSVGFWDER
jgi:hypothetical protein